MLWFLIITIVWGAAVIIGRYLLEGSSYSDLSVMEAGVLQRRTYWDPKFIKANAETLWVFFPKPWYVIIPPFISIVLQIQLFFLFCYLLTKLITTIKAFKSHHSLKFTMTYYQTVFSKTTYSSSAVFKMTDSALCQENFRITTSIILRVYHWKNIEKYRKDRN